MRNDITKSGLSALGLDETKAEALCAFGDMLIEKNKVMNLTGITEEAEVSTLHFLDCACLLSAADFQSKSVVDVGTGAGFPGVPLCILQPNASVTLLDSLNKRIEFLKEVCTALSLENADCVHGRAEEFAAAHRASFDIATSRAVASLNILCELSLPMLKVGGIFLAMKSVDSDAEIDGAKHAIEVLGGKLLDNYDYAIPGTDITHRVVRIEKVKECAAKYPRRFAMIKKSPL